MQLTNTIAKRIASKMRRDGFTCTESDVFEVWATGAHCENEFLASRILQEFDEYGLVAG